MKILKVHLKIRVLCPFVQCVCGLSMRQITGWVPQHRKVSEALSLLLPGTGPDTGENKKEKGDLAAKDKKFPQRITLAITGKHYYLLSITKYPYLGGRGI